MPKVACLGKFKEVLVDIPEIHGFPIRDGRTFKVRGVDGLMADFDLMEKKRVRALVVECCQEINMQQILIGLPVGFGMDQLELVVAKAMFGFSRQGISCGLGGCTLYAKNLITSRVQILLEELKKGGSEKVMEKAAPAVKRQHVSWDVSWDKLIDNLVGEKDIEVGKYWEVIRLADTLVKADIFKSRGAAKTFMMAATKRGLMKKIGGRKYCKWHIFNLSWPKGDNGKVAITEETPTPENSSPPVDLMVSELLENVDDVKGLQDWLKKVFGDNPELARSFAEKCGEQIEHMKKVKRAAELYANFVDGMKNL